MVKFQIMKVRRSTKHFQRLNKEYKIGIKIFIIITECCEYNGEQYLQNANQKRKEKKWSFTKQYYTQVNTQIGGKKITFYKMQRLYMKKLLEDIQ